MASNGRLGQKCKGIDKGIERGWRTMATGGVIGDCEENKGGSVSAVLIDQKKEGDIEQLEAFCVVLFAISSSLHLLYFLLKMKEVVSFYC
ncbi:hypothetical protein SLE2022_328810 [Rubroshorea leprosula]